MKMDIIGHNTPAILIFRAMLAAQKRAGIDMDEMFGIKIGDTTAEVVLTINGVEADVIQSLQQAWEILNSHRDEDILAKAQELVSAAGLDGIHDALKSAEQLFIQRLEETQKALLQK